MAGSKPNAYLSEEARLEAQRRMLAERYGLGLSDDSDDAADVEDDEPSREPETELNGNGTSDRNAPSTDASRTDDKTPVDDVPSEAATYGEGSSLNDGELASVFSQEEPYSEMASDRFAGWPGVEIVDSEEKKIQAVYEYDTASQNEFVSTRDLRVTKITNYTSQALENHGRKIAVNDQIISYAVGGHIRAILRNSSIKALLKGHGSTVVDMEFLSLQEHHFGNIPGEAVSGTHLSVLASVAEDGTVFVWKLLRSEKNGEDVLQVADAISFEHPEAKKGKSYSRIFFRPGTSCILSPNGIGVAMLLVDADAPDVRVVELVKMEEKLMVRSKFLRGTMELVKSENTDAKVDAATWLTDRIIATSRCGHVYLWRTEGTQKACIAQLPREHTTTVTSMYAISEETLLLVTEGGKQLEVWSVCKVPDQLNTRVVSLRQVVCLFEEDTSDLYCVTAVDPNAELVVVANAKGTTFFVLHYNSAAQAFDALTEVPVKQSILSLCLTRNVRKTRDVATPVLNPDSEELGIWCVQPRNIQMIHLPVRDCGPRTVVESTVLPTESPRTVTIDLKGSALTNSSVGSADAPRTPGSKDDTTTVASTSKEPTSTAAGALPPLHPSSKRSVPSKPTMEAKVNNKGNSPDPKSEAESTMSSKDIGASTKEATPDADALANSFLAAAKSAIEEFEASATSRNTTEKENMDRVLHNVTKTAEANLERFVNAAMKKTLEDTLIPGISKMIADSKATMRQRERVDTTLTRELFERSLVTSSINESFANACTEMTRQVGSAVGQSMSSKHEILISPTVASIGEAAEDLMTSVSLLRSEIEKLGSGGQDGSKEAANVVTIEPEDMRRSIEEKVGKGFVEDAFLTALDKEDVSLVTWLCSKFDASSFFEEYSMSQTCVLSLAQQLSSGLGEGEEAELKVEWLRELMLVLEPESEEIETHATGVMKDVSTNVNALRKNSRVLGEHSGLDKALKTLNRLVASHMPN